MKAAGLQANRLARCIFTTDSTQASGTTRPWSLSWRKSIGQKRICSVLGDLSPAQFAVQWRAQQRA
jgi:hypothetical protein